MIKVFRLTLQPHFFLQVCSPYCLPFAHNYVRYFAQVLACHLLAIFATSLAILLMIWLATLLGIFLVITLRRVEIRTLIFCISFFPLTNSFYKCISWLLVNTIINTSLIHHVILCQPIYSWGFEKKSEGGWLGVSHHRFHWDIVHLWVPSSLYYSVSPRCSTQYSVLPFFWILLK